MAVQGWNPAAISAPAFRPYRSSWTRARLAMVLIGITVAVVVLEGAAILPGHDLIDNAVNYADIEQYQANLDQVVTVYYLALLCSGVAYLAWLSRAIDNVRALGGGPPSFTPAAAIGWWFVPVASLFQGYRSMADLWRRMALSAGQRGTALVLLWWLAWVGSNLSSLVFSDFIPETTDEYHTLLTVGLVLLLVNAAAGIILIRVIWVVEQRARFRAALLALKVPGPTTTPVSVNPTTRVFPVASADATDPASEARPPSLPLPPPMPPPLPPPSASWRCPRCGSGWIPGIRFCTGCGQDLAMLERAGSAT